VDNDSMRVPRSQPITALPGAGQPVLRLALILGLLGMGYLSANFLPRAFLYVLYVAVLAAAAYFDFRERRVPNIVSYPAILFALGAMQRTPGGWQSALLGALIAAAIMLAPVLIYGAQRAGIGDVKLALFIGLVLGLTSALFWAALIAFATAAIVGLIGVILGRLTFKSSLAFGPFMALGAGGVLAYLMLSA